jgi:hypothetical protein
MLTPWRRVGFNKIQYTGRKRPARKYKSARSDMNILPKIWAFANIRFFKLKNMNLIAKTLPKSKSLVGVSAGKETIVLFLSDAITSKSETAFLKL